MTRKHPIDRRLTEARPDELDVAVDPARRQRDLDAAFSTPPAVRRSRRPMVMAVAGALCLAALCLVAIAVPYALRDDGVRRVAEAPPSSHPTTALPTIRAMSARQALLGAAAAAWQLPAATGAYWHNRGMYITTHRVLEGPYLVESRQRDDNWVAANAKATSWWITQHLGARPVNGGPGSDRSYWSVPLDIKCIGAAARCPRSHRLDARPGRASASPSNLGDKVFDLAGRNVSVADLRKLPADPKRLKARLLATYEGHSTEAESDPMSATVWLFSIGSGLVTSMPVTPAVRAAAFRMLADLPGIRVINGVRDALGRTGTAVAITSAISGGGVLEDRLVLDVSSSTALAQESFVLKPDKLRQGFAPGTRWHSHVIVSAGWTDERPVLPKG